MKLKKPIDRAIDVFIGRQGEAQELRGTFYARDFGDQSTEHVLEGHLTDSRGQTRRFFGQLSGLQFVSRETRGAPKKTGRDVALYLAYMWFLGAVKLRVTGAEREAREQVMELWAKDGFVGATEETHLRKRLSEGRKVVHGLSLLHYVCTSNAPDGAMVAAPAKAFDLQMGVRIGINGPGWFWRYGMEEAVYSNHSAVAPLTSDEQ